MIMMMIIIAIKDMAVIHGIISRIMSKTSIIKVTSISSLDICWDVTGCVTDDNCAGCWSLANDRGGLIDSIGSFKGRGLLLFPNFGGLYATLLPVSNLFEFTYKYHQFFKEYCKIQPPYSSKR
jgi:hypothetical protein